MAIQAIHSPTITLFSATILEAFRGLNDFVSRAEELLSLSSVTSETPYIAKFLQDLRSNTWKDIKAVFLKWVFWDIQVSTHLSLA